MPGPCSHDSGTSRGFRAELRVDSAISFASMADAGDFYGGLTPVIEEDTVIASAETETDLRRFEFFISPARLDR